MNTLLLLLSCIILCSLPHNTLACFDYGTSSSTSNQECTDNCSSFGCDMPLCEHDCTCLMTGITGRGCSMPKCKYNCTDSSGSRSDMRNCVSGCSCLKGNCDMRSCDPFSSFQTSSGNGSANANANNNASNDCFCGGTGPDDCGAKNANLEQIIGVAIASVFICVGLGIVYVYWKKKKQYKSSTSFEEGDIPHTPSPKSQYPSPLA